MEPIDSQRPLIASLAEAFQKHSHRPAQVVPGRGEAADHVLTFAEVWTEACRLASGFEQLGLQRGENVLLLSENLPRWLPVDLALLLLGCPSVPRGTDSPPDEVAFIVRKVHARVAVVESARALRLLQTSGAAVDHIVVLRSDPDDREIENASKARPYESLLDLGGPADAARAAGRDRVSRRSAGEIATIVFTSGTTGQPKGVVLTQGNLGSNLQQTTRAIRFMPEGSGMLSILPPWHMFERMVEYALLDLGLHIIYTDRRHFARDLKTYEPAVLAAVPRLWMMLQEGLLTRLKDAPPLRRLLVHAALFSAARVTHLRRRLRGAHPRLPGRTFGDRARAVREVAVGALLTPLHLLLRRLILVRITHAMGIRRLTQGAGISGGGSLPAHVELFFESLGTPLLNGYGLTETSPVLTLSRRERILVGTVGPPLEETELEIRDPETTELVARGKQGVVLVRGPQVMQGYHDEPQATAAVLSPDGWFQTGDLGRLSERGELLITGRAKDTIVLLSGENIDPEPLENALTASPWIRQAVVVGQDQKFLGALIVTDAESNGNGLLAPEVLRREIDLRVSPRRGFRAHERIARFRVVQTPFSVEDGSLSQTLKIKRPVIYERMSAEIQSMFDD